jgi:TonB family protein
MRHRLAMLVPVAMVVSACATSAPVLTEHTASACPLPAGAKGFPVVARSTGVDEATLTRIARAVLTHWGAKPDVAVGAQSPLEATLIPRVDRPTVFSRVGWVPRQGDSARVQLIFRPGGPTLVAATSPETDYQRRARAAVSKAIDAARMRYVAHDTMPAALGAGIESGVVTVYFGVQPSRGDGFARFALVETEVREVARIVPRYPDSQRASGRDGEVEVYFAVDPDGAPDVASIVVARETHRDFTLSVASALHAARFHPAAIDCVAIRSAAYQYFTVARR